jgi:hypothetical protein
MVIEEFERLVQAEKKEISGRVRYDIWWAHRRGGR